MNRNGLVASFGLVIGLATVVSAQAPASNDKVDQKAVQSIRVKVIGCVASGKEAGQYRLINTFRSGDGVPSPTGTGGKAGSGQDLSFENSPSFDRIGAVSRPMWATRSKSSASPATKMNHSDSFNAAIGSSTREPATLTVSSVKMIAATCP